MQTLPINQVLPQVKQALLSSNRLVLQAPPGAGKTTALPLALLEEPWLKDKKIIMLEPRRLAVRSSAARMAELLGEKVGKRVGYQIKMESVQSKDTKILIVTEGILTRKLQADPGLEDIALVIFDEFHERSLHADLSLALTLESQSVLREDLKVLVMSATLNTSAISKLLDQAPIIQSEGRSFPVESIYLPTHTPQPTKKEIPSFVHTLLLDILRNEEGNILVFLSGMREIKAVEKLLNTMKPKDVFISTLYGNLSKDAQDRAIKAPAKGFRKVVLSTNIAQTSLTIEGITVVVDSGLHNVSVFNPFSGMNKLESTFISQDSATQRAGRAGRLSAGKAYHLWHKSKILLKHDVPEILSADLTQMFLELALWGNDDMNSLSWMDTPPATAITHAKELLEQLGALDSKGIITSHGRAMSRYGLHPRLAHMMLKAKALDLSYEASLLSVLVSEKDIYHNAFGSSDMRERVSVLHDVTNKIAVNTQFINLKQCHYVLANAKRIEKVQKETINLKMLGILLAFAYPDRIAKQRSEHNNTYLLSNAKGASLHRGDELFHARFLVLSDLDARTKEATIYKAIELTQVQIEEHLKEQIEVREAVTWNEEQQRVEVRRVQCLGAIILREIQITNASNEEVLTVLLEELEALGLNALNWSKEAQTLRQRVNFVNAYGMAFPDFSNDYLLENMDEWLAPYLTGVSTLRGCQNLDLHNILLGQLSFEQTKQLDTLAPSKLKVASGSHIAIDYSNPKQPILAVRLQEMFGTKATPTVLNGKVKLMIHLLSPASRPMQVTQDLKNFWKSTYDEVKKELRGKYKKHYWPDDPLTAQATSKTKKNM
ncbi:ATP-dependent helicase HrpB [Sulfurovum sp. CS9]|uniref:ATP-dependent helicase HrpB n=1 Tax=Sulfurovum sp. CS9 TaxID=3391146 RepID=UPI0039EC8A30